MKKLLLSILSVVLVSALTLAGCGKVDQTTTGVGQQQGQATPVSPEKDTNEAKDVGPKYVNGLYRGSYSDEVVVRFKLADNNITEISFQTLKHGGTNYRELKEGDEKYPILVQNNQALEYLTGKPISAISDLYTPGNFIDDIDAYTGATVRTSKIHSAIKDALNRGVYTPDNVADVSVNNKEYTSGSYRGYFEGQVTIWFDLENNIFKNVKYRALQHGGTNYLELKEGDPKYPVVEQQNQLIAHLEGKPLSTLNDLYTPGNFVKDIDTYSGSTIRASKLISAINDGLNRGAYKPVEGFVGTIGEYEDGRYRGIYEDQILIQLNLENNVMKDINFRLLSHNGNNYLKMKEGDPLYPVYQQNLQALEYLEGKPLSAVYDLYKPGDFVKDIDTHSGATIRGSKILSAIKDALNRGIY
ncbi:MAG TPA: FMN-binding protein [Desulfitobacterium dehalogenans]|uniref:FMN-binding protein n=1 Tax=Desulfitobacterium dehalogenans TaxID=36854 RepID=A0A7C6Z3R6_9FIRM|nr:FMN-binding protein [Desulfitobacterium dehalogenans]